LWLNPKGSISFSHEPGFFSHFWMTMLKKTVTKLQCNSVYPMISDYSQGSFPFSFKKVS
jgi:hypothetical protein